MARRVIGPWYRASKGTWYATVGGRKLSLGIRGEENRDAAVKAWHRIMADGPEAVATPKPAKPEPESAEKPPTVADVLTAFLADCHGRLKPATVRGYRDFLTPFQAAHGQVKATVLTTATAETYSRRPAWGNSTRHGFLAALSAAFRWAERTGRLPSNPLRHLRKPPIDSRGDKVLITADEHARLLQAAPSYFKPFLQLLYLTGARPGEVASITAERFDPTAGAVRLREHKTARHGKRRVIFLSTEAVAVLTGQLARYGSGHLLRGRWGLPYSKNAVVHSFQSLRRKTGIRHATAYGYRHSFATDALSRGVPDAIVAGLLGHSGTTMIHRHYNHLSARTAVLRSALSQVR
jgi:integrase